MRYAQIVVNTPLGVTQAREEGVPLAESLRERAFTYSIPDHLADTLAVGQLVWVPFGTRRLQGVVIGLSKTSPVAETKNVDEIVDPRPLLSAIHLDLARWLARTYLCSLNDAIQLMVPIGVEQTPKIFLALDANAPRDQLTDKQAALVALFADKSEIELGDIPRDLRGAIDALARRAIIIKRTVVPPPRAKPRRVKFARLVNADALDLLKPHDLRGMERYKAILDFLANEDGAVWVSALYAATDCTLAHLRKLETLGAIALEEDELLRDSLAGKTFDVVAPPQLTSEQQAAWDAIKSRIRNSEFRIQNSESPITNYQLPLTFLLHGVTGSGKTEIYLRALDEILKQGKQGIVLVPEISLTPQTIRRFGARFPNRIAVVHSKLSEGERFDTWRRCRDGKVDIVIGARSALFAPLPRLGLIVLDEEHDPAFKQETVPHYHARETALELARRVGALVILGSATPDLETYYRATRGEFTLLEMPKRVMGHAQVIANEIAEFQVPARKLRVHKLDADARYLDLPPIEIVDLRAELKAGNRSMFSRALQRELARVLAAKEQAILFLNRRGTATFILCRDCGNVFKCRRCDNPMTYHGTGDQLVCHHCNRRDRVPTKCPQCGGARIRFFGIGTEKVQAEIQTLFPHARTQRWDWDVTQGKDAHEGILENFIHRRADILIGTQMIAKGLDLPFVTLVGVISADTSLNLPDFRAAERAFQLLAQVAGRAGRSILGGKVIAQTYSPDHYAIQAASQHDYRAFYDREIAFRREQGYPPFNRLIRLLYTHPNEKKAQAETARVHHALTTRLAQRGLPALDLIGPAPAFFHKERGQFRYQIILRGRDPHALVADIALPFGWRVDVDPVSVL
ncbi:MAG: primosomal protein N' [Chloroflexi bacterium]|nr:primosomal protein N' [Chloroflexota bacterium]